MPSHPYMLWRRRRKAQLTPRGEKPSVRRLCGLQQIPAVAPRIAPDRHRAIILNARGFLEHPARRDDPRRIAGKIIGVQKQPDPPAGLITDRRLLPRASGLGQHQCRTTLRRLHRHPALVALIYIGGQPEPQTIAEEPDRLIIVRHHQRQRADHRQIAFIPA